MSTECIVPRVWIGNKHQKMKVTVVSKEKTTVHISCNSFRYLVAIICESGECSTEIRTRDVQNGFFKFGLVLRKPWVQFGFVSALKNCRFGFLFRSVVKFKKMYAVFLVCAFCILVDGFLNAQLVAYF